MSRPKQNYYGSLCAEMYEILHKTAPREELDFYLSYAEKGKKILEPLCGDSISSDSTYPKKCWTS